MEKKGKRCVRLIDDVWYNISEFVGLQKLPDILVLRKGIYCLVDSDFSWRKRIVREFLPDQIRKVKSWFPKFSFKEIFVMMVTEFRYKVGDFMRISRVDKCYECFDEEEKEEYLDVEHVGTSFDHQVLQVVDSSHEIRCKNEITNHLKEWFEETEEETTFFLPKPTSTKNLRISTHTSTIVNKAPDGKIHYPGKDFYIKFGNLSFSFFCMDTTQVDDLFGLECCISILSPTKNCEKRVVISSILDYCLFERMFIFDEEDMLCYNIGRSVSPLPCNDQTFSSGYNQLSDPEKEKLDLNKLEDQNLKNLLLSYSSHDFKNDIFSSAKEEGEFNNGKRKRTRYRFNLECHILLSTSSSEKKFEGSLFLESMVSGENLEENNGDGEKKSFDCIFYHGKFTSKEEEGNKIDVCGTSLSKYMTLIFVDRKKKNCLFYLGGKIVRKCVKGILFNPNLEKREIHGLFTMKLL